LKEFLKDFRISNINTDNARFMLDSLYMKKVHYLLVKVLI